VIRLPDWHPTLDGRPALVVGKGPSAAHIDNLDLRCFFVATLNHAIRIVPSAEVAHFIDIEALIDCAPDVADKARFLVMPEFPHVKMTQSKTPTHDWEAVRPFLGKLVTYSKHPGPISTAPEGLIACRYFSAEALFGILGTLGFREVRSIGVDGGADYSAQFKGLVPLTNGQKSFDVQMEHLGEIAKRYGFSWKRFTPEGVDPRTVR